MAEPAVGVIVVTYNSRAHFPRLKAALEAQTARFELIVVDNASHAEQRPQPSDLPAGARLLQMEDNLGFASANNRAAALLETGFIVLLNPDAFPEPDWLAQLLDAAARWPQAASFGSTQIAANATDTYDGLGDCYAVAGLPYRGGYGWRRATTPALEGEVFSVCAAAALYRADAWRAAGGFDERFVSYCEDVDLGFRLRLLGWTNVQAARAVVHHIGGASSGRRAAYAVFHGARNRLWTYVKNMPGWLMALSLPAHLAATMLLLAAAPFNGSGWPAWRGVGAALAGLGAALKERARIQRTNKARLGDLARAMVWRPDRVVRRAPKVRIRS